MKEYSRLAVSYQCIRNATMPLKHKAAFQALLDYLIQQCCHTLVTTMLCGETNLFHHCCLSFLQKLNNHSGIGLRLKSRAGQWHKAARCPISTECIVQSSVFTAAGKSAIYSLALALNNGADSMSYILLFPSLWETALGWSYFWRGL